MTLNEEIGEHIRRVVDDAPPLTDAQRDRIASILRGGAVVEISHDQPSVLELAEQKRQQLAAEARRLIREIGACVHCGAPEFTHTKSGHDWEPNPLAFRSPR